VLNQEIDAILETAKPRGWVLEPEAKRLLALCGIAVPRFRWVRRREEVPAAGEAIGYPVVAKVVSPSALHKTEVGGVIVGIDRPDALLEAFDRFSRVESFDGMLVEECLGGVELIVGARVDLQFGPIVLLGIGGRAVEVYRDTALRMVPLQPEDVLSMVKNLRAHRLLEGFRGAAAVSIPHLTALLMAFSELLMGLGDRIDSADLNPVMCDAAQCVAADARIILRPDV
jgi:hypothetical protein